MKNVLIAYYSYSGNTKFVAQQIQAIKGGDLFEIKTKESYPKNYNDVVNQAKIEKQNGVKPELVDIGNIEGYDVIFIGTPVWWYTFASPIRTFLTSNDFSGKIIVPFCTHGGGGASSTYSDIKTLLPNAEVLDGFTSYENSAKTLEIEKWIKGLNL